MEIEVVVMETVLQIATTLLVTLIGVLGTWLTAKIAENTNLQSIKVATDELIKMAQQTVLELQQTVVDKLKEDRKDGKLTSDEVKELGEMLVHKTMEKMSDKTIKLLAASGKDVSAMIHGAGEAFINQTRNLKT